MTYGTNKIRSELKVLENNPGYPSVATIGPHDAIRLGLLALCEIAEQVDRLARTLGAKTEEE